jgi:hypothetical protein
MSNSSLQPDPDALRESAISVITYVRDAMHEGVALLREHNRLLVENQGEHRLESEVQAINENLRHVNDNLERVKRSELTMTIVAPTSAGKSTIINAIAGQDLLPSRNDAMTVLPTEIVFSREVKKHPELFLGRTLKVLLLEAERQLQQKLHRIGMDEAVRQATKNDFPRKDVIQKFFNSSVFYQSKDVESNDIQASLIRINELLRLCGIFGIPTEFLSSLSEILRIKVPFPPLLSSLKDSGLGTLVLVDTPGPSEDKSLDLVNVVEDRLNVSSLVLVVVDYMTITRPEIQAKVKELVDKMAAIKGRDRIYIIVNKIDARDPNNPEDLKTEQIFDLVKTKYEIDDPQNRVFEMSAIEAFLATNFQREKDIYQLTELRGRKSFEALGREYYAKPWKTQKTTVTLEEMHKAANEFLEDSGFVGFVDKAVMPLVPSIITIKGALNDISQKFASFLSCLSKQKAILEQNIQQLEEQINVLEAELKEVISIYTSLQWQEKILSSVKSISNKQIEKNDKALHNFTNEFPNFFDHQLDILWDRLIKFNIADTDRHYLVIVNSKYMNISMLREIVNFHRICCIKINEIYDEFVDKLHNLSLQFIEDINYHLNSDNSFINKIQERMQKKLNQNFLLDKDKYTNCFQGVKEVARKNCDAYEANISKYEEKLKKYESSSTVVGNSKIYWGEDLPDFIQTGYTSYDPIETLDPYRSSRYHCYQNPTVVESLRRSIEISSVRVSTTTSYDFYSFYQERVSKIRSICIQKKISFVSVMNLYSDVSNALDNNFQPTDTPVEDFTKILWNRYHLFKEYEQYLRKSIEINKEKQNSYAMFKNQYIQFLDGIASLEKDLQYQQDYSKH